MGLIERRLIKVGQEEWAPIAQKELRELTASEQTYDVDWDSFSSDADALNNVRNQGMQRINGAFRVICADDLGKEAVRDQVKSIVLRNVASIGEKGISLKDGVLLIKCAWGKGTDGYYSDTEIMRAVEKML